MAWDTIQTLIDNDPLPWPKKISQNPDTYDWCLCFNDAQLFINISASGHKTLNSRNLNESLCLVVNPREIFDKVAPFSTKKGMTIRNKIRERIKVYNESESVPEKLGFFGDKSNREWEQYQLSENGSFDIKSCPLKMRKS